MYWSNETPGRFLTADDCFFVTTRDEDWIKGVTTMLEEAFEAYMRVALSDINLR